MANNPTLAQKAVMEAFGTFLLVFLGGGALITSSFFFPAGASQLLIVAIAYGMALAFAVTVAMGISGGHLNPGVTIAMLATKRISLSDSAVYILSQLIGAIIGAAFLFIFPSQAGAAVAWSVPLVSSSIGALKAVAFEALITFVLVSAVFWTAVDSRAPKIAGFGIGLSLVLGILLAGPFTGAAANPARALGPMIATLNFSNWYVYVAGPILGGLVAAYLYEFVNSMRKRQ